VRTKGGKRSHSNKKKIGRVSPRELDRLLKKQEDRIKGEQKKKGHLKSEKTEGREGRRPIVLPKHGKLPAKGGNAVGKGAWSERSRTSSQFRSEGNQLKEGKIYARKNESHPLVRINKGGNGNPVNGRKRQGGKKTISPPHEKRKSDKKEEGPARGKRKRRTMKARHHGAGRRYESPTGGKKDNNIATKKKKKVRQTDLKRKNGFESRQK